VEGSLLPVPRNADELHDLLRRAGDLREGELDAGFSETLVRERRAFRARIGAAEAVIAAEDAGLYRDAFGVMPPGGLPESFLEPVDDPIERILLRYARSRGPFTTRDAASRFALEPAVVEALLAALEARDLLVRGELRPGGVEREWCDPDVLRRIRRASLAVLRRQVEPAEQQARGRFLPSWDGIDRRATLREALVPLLGLALPVALWESEILPRRVPGYQPASLDQLCASGDVVWVGAGLDRVALYYREDAAVLGPPGTGEPLAGLVHDSVRGVLARSAEFWPDLVAAVGSEVADALPALWELVWNGEVTNDAWAPLRAKRRYGVPAAERRPRRFSRSRVSGDVATAGRWSLTGRLFASDTVSLAADRRALAELLLERQGIVTRDGVRAEGIPGGYGAVYGELRALENVGACRRGYFVEGLGGAQFALPGAVERLRELRDAGDEDALVLAAAEPAQPYGGVLPWPRRAAARAARVAGAHVVLLGGEAALYVERGGRSLLPLRDPDPEWLRPALEALVEWVRADRGRRLSVERFDGRPVVESDVLPLLVEAGFLAGPRRAVLRP
jgi:ATP-dependent Lhr-like helicase